MGGLLMLVTSACLIENPLWSESTPADSSATGSNETTTSGADSASADEDSTTSQGPGDSLSQTSSLDTTDSAASTSDVETSSTDTDTDTGTPPVVLDCDAPPIIYPLPDTSGWTDFDIATAGESVAIAVNLNGTVRAYELDPSGVTLTLDAELGGTWVLPNLSEGELILAVNVDGGLNAGLHRTILGSGTVEQLRTFSVPIFPVSGLLRHEDQWTLMTRTVAGSNSPPYLVRLPFDSELPQVDDPPLPFGNTTWFVEQDGHGQSDWLALRTGSTGCIVMRTGGTGEVVENWGVAGQCFHPFVTGVAEDRGLLAYHRGDDDVYVQTFGPGKTVSAPLVLGAGGVDDSSPSIGATNSSALVSWRSDSRLAATVLNTESLDVTTFGDLPLLGPTAGMFPLVFATPMGFGGVVYEGTDGTLFAAVLCGANT